MTSKKKKGNVCILIVVAISFKSKHIKRFWERYRTIFAQISTDFKAFCKIKTFGVGIVPPAPHLPHQ